MFYVSLQNLIMNLKILRKILDAFWMVLINFLTFHRWFSNESATCALRPSMLVLIVTAAALFLACKQFEGQRRCWSVQKVILFKKLLFLPPEVHLPSQQRMIRTLCLVSRAATNVRTFEYYSFEIFTNELFLRTNVRWRPLVYFWLTHCGAELRPRAWEPWMHGATLEILRWRLSCHVPESNSERSGNMNFQLEEKHERQSF